MSVIYRWLENFFWRTLCCTPDSDWRIFHWWYSWTGNVARYFHRKRCPECQGRAYRSRL